MDPHLRRLEDSRDDLARRWLLRVIEEASLDEIARLPTDRIARELPALISDVVRSAAANAAGERAVEPSSDASGAAPDPGRAIARLTSLRAQERPDPAALTRDVVALQSVLTEGLAAGVADPDARAVLAASERVGGALGAMLAAAVEELVEARSRELESLANTDALTGLFNVRYMREHLAHLIGIQQRYGHPFAVLLLDIDGLKRINDAHGHSMGDRALISVADCLRRTIRSIDTAVRLGGDEFCVLAPHQTAPRVRVLGERLAEAVSAIEGPAGVPVGVSVGVVSCPQHALDADRLLELADEAMYRAKASGTRVAVAAALTGAGGEGELDEPAPARPARPSS